MDIDINSPYFACTDGNFTSSKDNATYTNCHTIIGYSQNHSVPVIFMIFSVVGLILNLLLIIDYYRKRNTSSSRKQSSMKKLFTVLPILDCITCIYWILSCSIFWRAQVINDHEIICTILSILYLLVFNFEFMYINFVLIHFRKISLNPIEGILKPEKNLIIYFIISIVYAIVILILSLYFKIIGRSPMITCFINTEQSKYNGLIFLIPGFTIYFIIFQIIYDLCCREMFVTDKEVRQAYKTNIIYVLVFTLMHFPMLLLIYITSGKSEGINQDDIVLTNFAFSCTLITCGTPMTIGIIRNCRGFSKIKQIQKLKRRFTKVNMEGFNPEMTKPFNDNSTSTVDQFDWLEKHALEFFMRDILLGIAHCLYNSKENYKNGQLDLQNKANEETIKHHITLKNFEFKEKEKGVVESGYLNVNIIEYAPKIFAYLRNLEDIDIDEMIESFLPHNNQKGISKSQGKSGSFFISTDDNYYMVKTLRVDEFELIRHTFLNKYVQYLTYNKESLLCRIYGMYNIILSQGDEMLIIVMRNTLGDFKDNIIAKYDLKGSTANRRSDFDMEKNDSSTMKDLNFNEFEHGIMLNKKHIKHFRNMTKLDSTFLRDLELMDYSVFLVKLTLSKEQAIDIFGREIFEKQNNAFNDMMISESVNDTENNNLGSNSDDNLKINKNSKPRTSIIGLGQYFNTKHYKNYLFPSLTPGVAYILAIIDYFQMFNFYKYVESGLKTKFSKNAEGVSCVDPKTYSDRFIKYFERMTDIKKLFKDNDNNANDSSDSDSRNNSSSNLTLEGANIELKAIN